MVIIWLPPVPWPPRPPDLNRLDFFYWSEIKKIVDKAPVEDEQELVARTFAAAGAGEIQDDPKVIQNIRENFKDANIDEDINFFIL